MNCAAICLLTAAVQFTPLPTTTNCTYCVETRSTYKDCFNNVIDCAYRDPSSLIFCLNIFEKQNSNAAIVQHTIRCVSYQDHYIDDDDIVQTTMKGSCAFEHVQKCECNECLSPPPLTTLLPSSAPTMHSFDKKNQKHNYHLEHVADIDKKNRKHFLLENKTYAKLYKSCRTTLNFFAVLTIVLLFIH